jgi:hypothetical protein
MERANVVARGGWIIAFGVLLGWWTAAAVAQPPQAQPRAVIWLDHAAIGTQEGEGAARAERERALRLELQARDYLLLESRPSDRSVPPSQAATTLLARTTAAAVLWLEPDKERPVSWLMVRVRQRDEAAKSPLPHPPYAIEPQLIAIAAASLLDQELREEPKPPPWAAVPIPVQAAPFVQRSEARPWVYPLPEPPPPPDSFLQLGLVVTFGRLTPGMEASSSPRASELYLPNRSSFLFDDTTPWVPDADSFDDYEQRDPVTGVVNVPSGTTPASTQCPADGIETASGEWPSKFCARVMEPGFRAMPALRLAVGRWFLPTLALSAFYQWHFLIEAEEPLGSHLVGVQGEYMIAGQLGRGAALTLFTALAIGRNETPVAAPRYPKSRNVNALAGLLLVESGLVLRVATSRRVALLGTASVGGRLPEAQLELKLGLGVEHGF